MSGQGDTEAGGLSEGIAANVGMVRAFEEALNTPVTLSPTTVMGAIGAVLLAHEYMGDKMETDPPTSKTER